MKIAHITTIDMALHLLLLNQLKSLQEVGFEVVGISSAGPDVSAIEAAGIRHIEVPMTRNFTPAADLMALKNLYDVMRRERFTIVHTHTPKPGLLGQMAARMAGVPIIVNTLHGFYFHDHMPTFWRQFYIATEKIAARCSHAILSQNSEDIQTAIREKICRPEQIEFLGNGINVQRFDRAKINEELLVKMRSDLGLTDADQVVGFVGRLVQEKGILDLLQAARIVLEHKPKTKFLIIGPIDEEKPDALRPTVAQDYGIAENCVFTGRRKDMPELYALMDVFVLPSYREGFPRSPMEAAAMGVPCIATDIRGCREAVIHNDNGLLSPLGNVKALAEAILTLLRDHRLAQQLGQAGRKLALAKFDEQLVFDKVKAKYARLLKEQGMPVPDLLSAQIVAS
ncbi:MAG: glycosyltransferase family 4 protein [Acidobacteria bacterium]|nr:glycosyltransferase family 4 protein [Acidobacteriota bacterium]